MALIFSCDDSMEILSLKVDEQVGLVGSVCPEHLELVIICVWYSNLQASALCLQCAQGSLALSIWQSSTSWICDSS